MSAVKNNKPLRHGIIGAVIGFAFALAGAFGLKNIEAFQKPATDAANAAVDAAVEKK